MYTSTSRTAEKASNLHTKKYFDMEEICKNGIMQAKQLDKLHDKQVRTQTGALPALPHQKRERGGGGERWETCSTYINRELLQTLRII